MRARRTATGSRAQRGWALVGAGLAVALVSLASLAPLRHEHTAQRRERETELLWIGDQYRRAIASYRAATPGSVPQYPMQLQDLLEDKRFPRPVRHLRRLYPDPMTGRADWELLRAQGAIVGVASRSGGAPFRQAGFAAADRAFEGAQRYSDWRFDASSLAAAAAPAGAEPPPPAEPVSPPSADRRTACLAEMTRALNGCLRLAGEAGLACRRELLARLQQCLR